MKIIDVLMTFSTKNREIKLCSEFLKFVHIVKMKKKYLAMWLLASFLNPLGQGKKVFPEKVKGKI